MRQCEVRANQNTHTHASNSFVDDLALVCNNPDHLQEMIDTIEAWCNDNFFRVGLKKSGVMIVGTDSPKTDFHIHNKPLKILNFEPDFSSIKYLEVEQKEELLRIKPQE